MTHKLKFLTLVLGGFILVFHITDAQRDDAQLAQEAFEVFEAHCLECHGEYGSYKDKLFIDRQTMVVEKKVVIPGNPDGSELYQRLLGDTKNWPRMPLDRAPLPPDQINIIRRWIEARAPDWRDIPKPKRNFIPTEAVISAIEEHVRSLPEFDRPFACYFILTHLYNAGASDEELNAYRVALSKLINSLSWEGEVIVPRPIDTTKTIFRIDLRDYDWDETTWQKIWQTPQRPYPYGVQLASPTYAKLCQYTACELPFLRADWFIARASLPPLYHEILELPTTDRDLEEKLDIDVIRNLRDSPGRRVWRAGFNNSGVSRNNRVVERHRSSYGAYWRSYDFSANVEKQNIFQHPLDFEQAGGEIIFNLPNGLQAYYLVNAKGERLDDAPIGIVFNKDAINDPVIHNGLTCMSCHTEGIKAFRDQVRATVEGTVNPPYDRTRALRLYVRSEEMNQLVEEDKGRFAKAVKAAGGVVGGRDPIVRLVKQFEAPLDVAHAAAEAGVKAEEFVRKIRAGGPLQNAGLTVLLTEGGMIQRDAWEEQFGLVAQEFATGKPIKPTPSLYPNASAPIKKNDDMVLIPAGEFQMGSDDGSDDEKPVHTVYLDAFYIDQYEVTNAQFKRFIDANPQWGVDRISKEYHNGNYLKLWDGNNYPSGKGDHPVVYVSWYAAAAYAQWVGKRLPTEAEWEKAARGGLVGNQYPWGDAIDPSQANYGGNVGDTTSVGKYPPNGYGLYDMAGNIWEWCMDEYDSGFYAKSPKNNPVAGDIISFVNNNFTNIKTIRVVRGGSWGSDEGNVRVSVRDWNVPSFTYPLDGFRCISSSSISR